MVKLNKNSKGGSAPAPANVSTNGNNLILQPTSQVTPNQSAAQIKVTNVQLQADKNSAMDNKVSQKGGKKSNRKTKRKLRIRRIKKRKNTHRNKKSRR